MYARRQSRERFARRTKNRATHLQIAKKSLPQKKLTQRTTEEDAAPTPREFFFLNSITRRQSQEELPARRSDREFNCKSQRNNYLAKTHAENLKRRNSTTMSLRVCIRRDKNRGQPKEKTRRRPRRRNDRGTHFQIAKQSLSQ